MCVCVLLCGNEVNGKLMEKFVGIDDEAVEATEHVLTIIEQCFAFRIPPQTSSAGHRYES